MIGMLLASLHLAPCTAQVLQFAPDSEMRRAIATQVQGLVDDQLFSGVVLVARDDKILTEAAFGIADAEFRILNGPSTRFRIASLSKPFTRLAIRQLEERGALRLDDRVSTFLPDFPNGERITIEQLLDHRSGLANLNDTPGYDEAAKGHYSTAQVVEQVRKLPMQFEPGTDEAYSNSGYALLARIVELVSRQDFGAYMKENIFAVAGMESSGHGVYGPIVPDLADGYIPSLSGSGVEHALFVDPSIKVGGGSLYSTVRDLLRFDRAFRAGLLSRATDPLYNEGVFGRLPGYTSMMWGNGEYFVAVLSNNYFTPIEALGLAVVRTVLGQEGVEPVRQPPEVPTRAAALDPYAGHYIVGGDSVEVRREGDALIKVVNGDMFRASRLRPIGPDEFFDPAEWEVFQFRSNGMGGYEMVEVH